MTWSDSRVLAELLGAIGVIASLIYLSRQVRQHTQGTRELDGSARGGGDCGRGREERRKGQSVNLGIPLVVTRADRVRCIKFDEIHRPTPNTLIWRTAPQPRSASAARQSCEFGYRNTPSNSRVIQRGPCGVFPSTHHARDKAPAPANRATCRSPLIDFYGGRCVRVSLECVRRCTVELLVGTIYREQTKGPARPRRVRRAKGLLASTQASERKSINCSVCYRNPAFSGLSGATNLWSSCMRGA